MLNQTYNWKRFWYPRGSICRLDYAGYLDDPESEYGHFSNPDVVTFESIAEVPCLVLLGEPGIGKSTAVEQAFEQTDKTAKALWFDLGEYQTDITLRDEVFKNSTFQDWLRGTHRLHLFLDSLDEGRLTINNLAKILGRELGKYPCDRLYFRIACRTADWPSSLEERLRDLWGKEVLGAYELAPLRRVDVFEAARVNNLDPGAFLDEVYERDAAPLVIKPVTLKLLLNIYSRDGQFPTTQKDLYYQGCRQLCEEANQDRRDFFTGNLTVDQRMIVAARIAAITVFSNRTAIWTGLDSDVPGQDVAIRELYGIESLNGHEFPINENAVREVLSITGLFSSHGLNRMGFAHQTYAEFLSAWYLEQHQMTLAQRMSLIQHPNDPDRKLVPQLHETAAWLASLVPDVFRKIMDTDPDVLLRSDIATADTTDRATLVESLLKLYDEEKLFLHNILGNYRNYQKLSHPGLAEQLQLYIHDASKSLDARYVAIDITEACELHSLQNDLTQVALDSTAPLYVRINAASALCHIGDDAVKARLKPLAMSDMSDDPDDELKGYGLRAVWPNHITADDLFSVITRPKAKSFGGAYQGFLTEELARHLQSEDLLVALKWVEEQQHRRELSYPFDALVDTIMFQAWKYFEFPGVLKTFVRIALTRWSNYEQLTRDHDSTSFESLLANNDERRHRLIEEVVAILPNSERDPLWLLGSSTQVVLQKDVLWMIGRLQASESEHTQRVWAQLIWRSFVRWELEHIDPILGASESNLVLYENFVSLIKPIELGSPEARKSQEYYLREQEWQNRNQSRPRLDPTPAQRIAERLDEFESGNYLAWWLLIKEMTLEPDSTYYGDEYEPDLTVSPGWKSAEPETRKKIVEAAKRYIRQGDPDTDTWLGTNTVYFPALAGYKALRILLQEVPDFLPSIQADTWKKWASTILAYPRTRNEDEELCCKLVKTAYQHAPQEIIESLILLIDKDNREYGSTDITRKVKDCWDSCLAEALLIKVKDEALKPQCMKQILSDLLKHGVGAAKTFAESLIPQNQLTRGGERARAIVAAHVLMLYAEDAGWSTIWSAIQGDPEFGREVMEAVSYSIKYEDSLEKRLNEECIADLYIFLTQQYPDTKEKDDSQDEELQGPGAYEIGSIDSVKMWRNYIPQRLQVRGTSQACEALRRIIRELPELKDKLRWRLLEAEALVRRQAWVPPEPKDILRVTSNHESHLVLSGDQLLDVLVESLRRLDQKLQGETPAAFLLWDQVVSRPKDENALSDYLKLYLEEDLKGRGVIANREVEIRRRQGTKGVAAPGERTDIQVDAVVRKSNGEVCDPVTVIIEVKGCWNKELNIAMQTQLVDRYLKDNSCQHGLYLVGWFNCNQWDSNDSRKSPKLSLEEARDKFVAQAAELSSQSVKVKAVVLNTALR